MIKNIVVLVPSLTIGGREKIALNTLKCLKDSYNVFLVVFERKDVEYDAPCEVNCLNAPATDNKIKKVFNVVKRGNRLISFCKKNHIDCIFSFGEAANLTGAYVKKFSDIKLLCSIHGFKEVRKGLQTDFFQKRADKIICISQDMEKEFLKLYPKAPTIVVENGYEIGAFQNNTPFEEGAPRIVSMGRLVPVKGFDRLINAFKIIKKALPLASLTIIGEGSERERLSVLSEGLDVDFAGYKKDPSKELLKNNIFILSSLNEGFPNSLIEALSLGLCVVSVDCHSGPREILSEKWTPSPISGIAFEKWGVLTEDSQKTADLLAEAVLKLAKDKEKIKYYREIGLKRARDFSIDVYKNKLRDVFEKLL